MFGEDTERVLRAIGVIIIIYVLLFRGLHLTFNASSGTPDYSEIANKAVNAVFREQFLRGDIGDTPPMGYPIQDPFKVMAAKKQPLTIPVQQKRRPLVPNKRSLSALSN